jgi:tripartite-type tricarboxylate transporter receptor subunit TctC
LRVNADVAGVLNTPEVKSYLAERGFDVATGSPEELAAILRGDFDIFGRIIREANIKAD